MSKRTILGVGAAALLAVAVVLVYAYVVAPEASHVKIGQAAPDFELPSMGGGHTRVSDFKGHPLLLVMFKSDCHRCQVELPRIEALHRRFRQEGLRVVGVAVDEDREKLGEFLRKARISFVVLEDPFGVVLRRTWGSYKMPETYLIDGEGIVRAAWLGAANWEGWEVRDPIRALLPSPRPSGAP